MRKGLWVGAAFVGLLGLVGCSSEPEEGTPDNPVSLPPADASDTKPGDCPFSGGTAPTSGGTGGAATTISKVSPTKDGCVDSIQFNFGGNTAKWTAAYATGPVTDANGAAVELPSGSNLVVTFENTSYGPSSTANVPVTIPPNSLQSVKQLTVASGSGGSLQFVMTVDEQLNYIISSSEAPAYVTLAVG